MIIIKESRLYKIIRPIVKLFTKVFLRPKYVGLENIKNNGRIILAGNHTNILDCLLVMSSTKRHVHFLAKDELWKGPKKLIFDNLGLIPVNRRQKDHNALKKAEKYLDNDLVVGIFPEGTVSKAGDLLPFKIGCVKMAKDTNSSIIPFVITGKYKLFSQDLKITFGKQLKIKNDNLEEENIKLRDEILKMIGMS